MTPAELEQLMKAAAAKQRIRKRYLIPGLACVAFAIGAASHSFDWAPLSLTAGLILLMLAVSPPAG